MRAHTHRCWAVSRAVHCCRLQRLLLFVSVAELVVQASGASGGGMVLPPSHRVVDPLDALAVRCWLPNHDRDRCGGALLASTLYAEDASQTLGGEALGKQLSAA